MHEEERDGGKMRSVKEGEAKEEKEDILCNYPSSQTSLRSTSVQSGVVMDLSGILRVLFAEHGGSDRPLRVAGLGEKRAR